MHMLVLYPQLLVSREPPDAKGHYKAVSEKLRPMEAAYLATTLLYQKAFNAEYQFTDVEGAQNRKLDAATVNAMHLERTKALQDLLHGNTQAISVRDLMTASDHFFSDLGIEPASNMRAAGPTTTNYLVSLKENWHRRASGIVIAGLGIFGLIGIRKRIKPTSFYVFLLIITATTIGLSGCGGGGSTPSAPTNTIYTKLSIYGVIQAWPNASLSGYALPGTYDCGSNDCGTKLSATTDSGGVYNLSTWAIPGVWDIAAKSDSNCSAGANSGQVNLGSGGITTLNCGFLYAANIASSPDNCYQYYYQDTGLVDTNCPMNISLTTTSSLFPTAHAMTVSGYDDTGTAVISSSPTASSTTEVTIPTPGYNSSGVVGYNVIVVTDPNTNEVLGATMFNWDFRSYPTNPRG
jgi:hypothetical protein